MKSHFERIYLINLKRRTDRLANFRQLQKENGWELPEPIIFEAFEGDKVGVPNYFTQGGGAFGCALSHKNILMRCIMDDVKTVLIFEDDIAWFPDIWEQLDEFMPKVPPMWDQIMLGGQHMHNAQKVKEGVYKCINTQRTHAYALQGRAMKSLLNLWYTCSVHIDWKMGDWQKSRQVFAPEKFFFGQRGGRSDISGRTNSSNFWINPQNNPVIVLDTPPEVVIELRSYGFHTGYSRDENDYDKGLHEVVTSPTKETAMRKWLDSILWEISSEEDKIAVVWHPEIKTELVKSVHDNIINIKGSTKEECLSKIPSFIKLKRHYCTSHILVLRNASRTTVENLGGFHRGYWTDHISGEDNGQREIAASSNKVEKLKDWIKIVGAEAERINAIPLIWQDAIDVDSIKKAMPNRTIIEISSDSLKEILQKWEDSCTKI